MKLPPAIVRRCFDYFYSLTFVFFTSTSFGNPDKSKTESIPPKSPEESRAAMKVKAGLEVQLVAAEPLIVDPVAIDWGADGKLWVAEMRDYPMGMDGNWKPGSRIKFLEDTNHDGKYDKATVFVDDLPFVTGVTAWRNGALICAAPNIFYAEDTNGDGRADTVKKIFRGFDTGNYQARVNSLSLGLDNWVYGANGLRGGVIRGEATAPSSQKKESQSAPIKVDIRGRDFRMNPDTGAFEPSSGLTQQGRARDDWENWFGCDNSTPAWHYTVPDHYLRRNPHVIAPSPKVAIAAGASGNLLYPVSEALERFNNPGALNRVTSGCGIGVYRDSLFGEEVYGNAFVCEPVHNVVHRMVLRPTSITFSAVRAKDEADSEFLASSDNWFRPAQMRTGPDGGVWVVDLYRFVIEHPRWIPPERLAKLDPRAGDDKGRIYRVVPKNEKLRAIPDLTKLSSAKLATMLDTSNGTERDRIHQELVFPANPNSKLRKVDRQTVKILETLAEKSKSPAVRLQALCVLDGLGVLKIESVERALSDHFPAVRANAIRLTEKFSNNNKKESTKLADILFTLADDPELIVRYQLTLTLGEWNDPRAGKVLGELLVRDINDQWMRAAVLSSATHKSAEILNVVFAKTPAGSERTQLISQLIATAVGDDKVDTLNSLIRTITPTDVQHLEPWQLGALGSLLDGLERKKLTYSAVAGGKEEIIGRINLVFDWAEKLAADAKADDSLREPAIRLLGRRPEKETADLQSLAGLLDPSVSGRLQAAALAMLKRHRRPEVGDLLLNRWNRLPPGLRQGTIEVLFSRDDWTKKFLAAIQGGAVAKSQLPLANRQLLLKSDNQEIKQMAETIWKSDSSTDRATVVKNYRVALSLPGDPLKGRSIWAKNCVVCHYFRGEGASVGPNLGALTDKTPEDFLIAILDPNAIVEPRYTAYNIETKDGRSLTGIVSAENATTLTLVQAGSTYETILRSDISESRASDLSLMPEGLDQNMSPQDLANLIAYLNSAPHPFGTATAEQAEAAKKKFLAAGNNGVAKIISAGEQSPYPGWMGKLPLSSCWQFEGKSKLTWETAPVSTDLQRDAVCEFRLPISIGSKSNPPGTFLLKLNGKPVINFGIALHDRAWHSDDGKVQMSYLVMEDSVHESNGIMTLSVSGSLLETGKPAMFEVIGQTPKTQSWFGIYQP
jgi:putative membrane-bound dehydrogenase-like protein